MTIAQQVADLAEKMGIENFECNKGSISDNLKALTLAKGGTVGNSGVISTSLLELKSYIGEEEPGEPEGPEEEEPGE